jgi:hypothetical protein
MPPGLIFVRNKKNKKTCFKNKCLHLVAGYYVPLSTLAEVREQVLHYIPVMARPLVLTKTEHPINWTPVYADITVSMIIIWSNVTAQHSPTSPSLHGA